jgi:hypothetical protein
LCQILRLTFFKIAYKNETYSVISPMGNSFANLVAATFMALSSQKKVHRLLKPDLIEVVGTYLNYTIRRTICITKKRIIKDLMLLIYVFFAISS